MFANEFQYVVALTLRRGMISGYIVVEKNVKIHLHEISLYYSIYNYTFDFETTLMYLSPFVFGIIQIFVYNNKSCCIVKRA